MKQEQYATMRNLIAALTGILFGLGLSVSQMVDRQRVLGFLDVTGNWDPTLMFVMGGAVAVTVVAFRFVLAHSRPLFDVRFHIPTLQSIDGRLITGAALFGIGWGISGYCPGPGFLALIQGQWNPVLFVLAFVAGAFCYEYVLPILQAFPRRFMVSTYKSSRTGESV